MTARAPLAERMRPQRVDDVVGQAHLLGPRAPLGAMLAQQRLQSMILWGPPGSGKTTLARLLASASDSHFVVLSAVMAGVADVRKAVAAARERQSEQATVTLLFLDEVHRFNKAQQDAFLPFIEDGTVVFIGATTENPAHALNNALLSRAPVYRLKALTAADIAALLQRALRAEAEALGLVADLLSPAQCQLLADAADGDARRALGLLEVALAVAAAGNGVSDAELQALVADSLRRHDNRGDTHYDQLSALHKSLRGSDPDAALYWLQRLLDGGCDPRVLARRLTRVASEDIGNADPRALAIAIDAWQAYERMGSPEGDLALAQACVFLACAAKSDAVYKAAAAATDAVKRGGSLPVPDRLCPAAGPSDRALGRGSGYRYAHDEPDAFAAGEVYLPDALAGQQYYHPNARGLEIRIRERLDELRARNRRAKGSTN